MSNRFVIFTTIAFLLLPPVVFTQSEYKQRQLATYGFATLRFPPDRVRFSFGVKGLGSSLEEAVKQATDRVVKISAKLKEVGINSEQMQTQYFNSSDNPGGRSWWSSSSDFAAAYEMTVTIDSVFDLVGPAIKAISGEPIEHLSQLEFSLRDDPTKRLKASTAAAIDARSKADQVAAALGASIVGVLYVEDQGQRGASQWSGMPVAAMMTASGVSVEARRAESNFVFPKKEFEVNGNVRVVFELDRKQ